MLAALGVFRHDVLQHVDVEGRVESDVWDQLQGLVLVGGLLQLCRLLPLRSVPDGDQNYGGYERHQGEHGHGCGDTQNPEVKM